MRNKFVLFNFLLVFLLVLCLSSCSNVKVSVDGGKLKSVGDKAFDLLVSKYVGEDILGLVKEIYSVFHIEFKISKEEKFSLKSELEKSDKLVKTDISLEPWVYRNGKILGNGVYELNGLGGDALIYFKANDSNGQKALHNLIIEADIEIINLKGDYATIALGGRGESGAPFWRGVSFQVLSFGAMKASNEAKDDSYSCLRDRIAPLAPSNKLHMSIALDGQEAYIALINYSDNSKYEQRCDIRELGVNTSGDLPYLFAWDAKVLFSNVKITAL